MTTLLEMNIKPMHIVFWATVIALSCAFIFGVIVAYGKLLQDKKSGKNTEKLILNTETANEKLIDIDVKTDTSNQGIETIKLENKNFKRQVENLEKQLNSKNQELISLATKTAELASRLSDKTTKIHDNSTGGNSYLTVNYKIHNGKPCSINLTCRIMSDLIYTGSIPLSNLAISLFQNGKIIGTTESKSISIAEIYGLGQFNFPDNSFFETFEIRISTPFRTYNQFIYLKKYIQDGNWYGHIIRDEDFMGINIREDKFDENYPNELKQQVPSVESYTSTFIEMKKFRKK